jgi:hypothetical protein
MHAVPAICHHEGESGSREKHATASIIATKDMEVSVDGVLVKKSAVVGLMPEGATEPTEEGCVRAQKVVEEDVRESKWQAQHMVNVSLGTFASVHSQVHEMRLLIAQSRMLRDLSQATGPDQFEVLQCLRTGRNSFVVIDPRKEE